MKKEINELVKGLENLLSSYKADFKNITGSDLNDTETVKKTKELIKKYKIVELLKKRGL